MWAGGWLAAALVLLAVGGPQPALSNQQALLFQEYPVTQGSHPHDAVPSRDGTVVWYAAQGDGTIGRLDPATGEYAVVRPGDGSAPHGIIMGPDDAAWVTDGGLNAIVRVDPVTMDVRVFPLPGPRSRCDRRASRGDTSSSGRGSHIRQTCE